MALTASKVVESFSMTHAAILNGTTGLQESFGDIYGVRSGTLAADIGNYDNTGDDAVLSSWFWINFATVTIESGYIPFETYSLLTGSTATSSGTGPSAVTSIPLYEEGSENQPARPMLIRAPARDADGNTMTLDVILYKVIFSPINFTGPAYKSGLLVNYTGRAVLSNKDEKGQVLAKRAVGRLVAANGTILPVA